MSPVALGKKVFAVKSYHAPLCGRQRWSPPRLWVILRIQSPRGRGAKMGAKACGSSRVQRGSTASTSTLIDCRAGPTFTGCGPETFGKPAGSLSCGSVLAPPSAPGCFGPLRAEQPGAEGLGFTPPNKGGCASRARNRRPFVSTCRVPPGEPAVWLRRLMGA
jgi:hypothetical protein